MTPAWKAIARGSTRPVDRAQSAELARCNNYGPVWWRQRREKRASVNSEVAMQGGEEEEGREVAK